MVRFCSFIYFRSDTQPGGRRVIVAVPVNKGQVLRQIEFERDILPSDFLDRIYATMDLDPAVGQLGWKYADAPKGGLAQQLQNGEDVAAAIKAVTAVMDNPRRRKPTIMLIVHLVSLSSFHYCTLINPTYIESA